MKTSQLVKLAGFSTLLLFSVGSMAGDKAMSSFEALDLDKDDSITATEASQDKELSKQWSEIDQDESGTIDRVEFSAFETMRTEEKQGQEGMGEQSEEGMGEQPKEEGSKY